MRTVLLAALLFVPDVTSGATLGLHVTWSRGLTLPNFVVPVLAAPLLFGAWWSGRKLFPERWPGLAAGMLVLLGWSLLTLAPAWLAAEGAALTRTGIATILAHAAKLALFILLGAALAGGGAAWRRRAGQLLLAAIAVNAVVGLAQAARLVLALSPLAQGAMPRATGLWYDANFYAVTCVWALLWLLCQNAPPGWRRWAAYALVLATAGNVVAAGSRAGFAAMAAGMAILWWTGHRRAVVRAAVLLAAMALLFPMRSWQRVRTAAATLVDAQGTGPVVAPSSDASTTDRLNSMREALAQIGRHPLLGLGYGRALYLGVPAVGGEEPVAPAQPFRGAQNMFLTVWAATGPIGLLLLLAAVAAPLRLLDRARRHRSAPVLAGYGGLLVACLTQEALWNARLLALAVMLTAAAGIGWSQQV
ncbi:MAG: O-antigen ligase family protein [Terriglobales bacterium]